MNRTVVVTVERWPLKHPFVIARGSRTETITVTVTIGDGDIVGHGEAAPSARYGESIARVVAEIESQRNSLAAGMDRCELQHVMPAGSARNAIDAALWDLDAKISGQDVSTMSGLQWPADVSTVQTISISSPDEMGREAARLRSFPILKVKMDANYILERLHYVNRNAPESRLLIDANESWTIELLEYYAPHLSSFCVDMVEQPLRAGKDEALRDFDSPIPLYADESCHTRADLSELYGKYNGINIKLDKTGGLTEAIALLNEAHSRGFEIMVGCMLSTSLGIAPAMFIATQAKYVDIDAPALLQNERIQCIRMGENGQWGLPRSVWGAATFLGQ